MGIVVLILIGCARQVKPAESQSTQSPGAPVEVSLTPSSFACEAKIISVNDNGVYQAVIQKIHQRGSALFFEVIEGDTLDVNLMGTQKINSAFPQDFRMIIEERLKINSDKPQFLIRDILKK